jgi:predicted nucleic acid-binding protein
MPWVIDSCIVLDVALNDVQFGLSSAQTIEQLKKNESLLICPVSLVEVAPFFGGELRAVREFARLMGVESHEPWGENDTREAALAWTRQVRLKREGQVLPRPMADVLIGAFALRRGGLVTRNPDHFKKVFPGLKVQIPLAPRTKG